MSRRVHLPGLLLVCSTGMAACAEKRQPVEAYLPVPDGRIWYRVSGSGRGTSVILLHGGPGYSSFYLKALEALGDERPVVRYDQLGGGKSDRISDTTLYTIPHFVRELDSLRAYLGYPRVHLVGHSWGTILAVEYYRAHPEHVASLTLASAALDIPAWERNARRLVGTLSDSAQRAGSPPRGPAWMDIRGTGRPSPSTTVPRTSTALRRTTWSSVPSGTRGCGGSTSRSRRPCTSTNTEVALAGRPRARARPEASV